MTDWELVLRDARTMRPLASIYPPGQPLLRLSWTLRAWDVGSLELEAPAAGLLLEALRQSQLLGAWLELRRDGASEGVYIVTAVRLQEGAARLELDISRHINVVYVGGQGEGTARALYAFGLDDPTLPGGLPAYRLEAFRDARDTSDLDTMRTRAVDDLRQTRPAAALAWEGEGTGPAIMEVEALDPGWLLSRRIVLPPPATHGPRQPIEGGWVQSVDISGAAQHQASGRPPEVLAAYVQAHLAAPAEASRQEPRIAVASPLPPGGGTLVHQARLAPLLEVCQEVGRRTLWAWDWRFDPVQGQAVFSPRALEDRTSIRVMSTRPFLGEGHGRDWRVGDLVMLEMEGLGYAAPARVIAATWEVQRGDAVPTLRLELERPAVSSLLPSPRAITVAGRL